MIDVSAITQLPADADADTVVLGVLDGEGIAHDVDGGSWEGPAPAATWPPPHPLQGLIDAGEARAKARHLAVVHAAGRRWILVGLGARGALDAEGARRAAAVALGRARELGARRLCWEVPHKVGDEIAAAIVEGTLLAAYRHTAFKSKPSDEPAGPEALLVSAHHELGEVVAEAAIVARAVNAARDLQNAPPNVLTPAALGEAARRLGELDGVSVEVEGRDGLRRRGMGAFAAVAQGGEAEPALITLRYAPEEPPRGPMLGLVGKAVTFDTGGISLKNPSKMSEMKFDMSGGAAVLGAVEAIARLRLPVRVVAVVGATENMPSGSAMRPGDVITASDGTTIEVINTDAEGRLVLADCLAHAVAEGAERIVDLATLTGAIVTALGSLHAGLMSDDDAWAAAVAAAGARSGELTWRLPLHPEYASELDSETADVMNVNEARKAGSIVAAQFLARFTGDVPWAHLDIAGTAWGVGRPYAAKGGSGFGVRLLVQLARDLARS